MTSPAPTPTVAEQIDEVQSWLTHIERTQARFNTPPDNCNAMYAAILRTLRNAAAMEKDAARYRWLRDPYSQIAKVIDKPGRELFDLYGRFDGYECEYRSGEELDAAIDASRDAKEQKT